MTFRENDDGLRRFIHRLSADVVCEVCVLWEPVRSGLCDAEVACLTRFGESYLLANQLLLSVGVHSLGSMSLLSGAKVKSVRYEVHTGVFLGTRDRGGISLLF